MNFQSFRLVFLIALIVFVYFPKLNFGQNSSINNKQNNYYRQVAFEKFGNDTVFNFSPQKTYILCGKKGDSTTMNPNKLTEFFVTKTENGNILYEDKISGASVSWQSDYELLITIQKGIITSTIDNGKYSYIYNIHTHMKSYINESLNLK